MDLNADLGELPGSSGAALDGALIEVISSANIACGGHAGNAGSMRRACDQAAFARVAIGAQVSYADRPGFGRVRLDVDTDVLARQLAEQAMTLHEHALGAGSRVSYLKPHGALYHAAASEPDVAEAVLLAIDMTGLRLPVLTLPDSELARQARHRGLEAFAEAFADRGYLADGGLVPRGQPGALLEDPAMVGARLEQLVRERAVTALDGTAIPLAAHSLCVHSDTPGAVELAREIRQRLTRLGVDVAPFLTAHS